MRRLCLFSLLLIAVALTAWSESVIIVADEWPQMDILKHFLQQEGGYDVSSAEQTAMPENLADFYAVFMFVHGQFESAAADRMIDYVKNGGRLVIMHHGISSAKRAVPQWMDFLGVLLPEKSQDPVNPFIYFHDVEYELVNLNPNHYITSHEVSWPVKTEYQSSDSPSRSREYAAWPMTGSEIYLFHNFTDGREKTVLCGFKFIDPKTGTVYMQDRGAWYKPSGKGWIFYFQPGHTSAEFQERNYCQMILNCLTWKPGE